jgi:hypothetical protein
MPKHTFGSLVFGIAERCIALHGATSESMKNTRIRVASKSLGAGYCLVAVWFWMAGYGLCVEAQYPL